MIWQLHCCLTSLFLCRRSALNSLHQGIFLLLDQHIAVPRVTSGGSRRRECPLPKKLPPFGHEPRDFWALPKSYGYFSGAPPSIPPCGFAVLVIPGKKAGFAPTGAECRSGTCLPVHSRVSPTRRENRSGFPGSQVFGAGTLPVGFQGRSALVAKGEIPVQETCTWREIQEIRVFLLDRTRIVGYIVIVIFKFIVIK